jgi:hypothetical protein
VAFDICQRADPPIFGSKMTRGDRTSRFAAGASGEQVIIAEHQDTPHQDRAPEGLVQRIGRCEPVARGSREERQAGRRRLAMGSWDADCGGTRRSTTVSVFLFPPERQIVRIGGCWCAGLYSEPRGRSSSRVYAGEHEVRPPRAPTSGWAGFDKRLGEYGSTPVWAPSHSSRCDRRFATSWLP